MAPADISVKSAVLDKNGTISRGCRAYVTFLAGAGDYVKGVIGLAKGLRKVKSLYPLVVAVLPDVPAEHRRLLAEQGCILKPVGWVQPPEQNENDQMEWAHEHFAVNYSKLRIFQFEEYSKMIYLDGDVQVYGNCDELFELADGYLYAVMDCFCDWYHSPQYKIGYCQQCPERVAWPDDMGSPPSSYFNAGMFVFQPSQATYNQLLETIKHFPSTSFAEQDLLNQFFKDTYKPIPPIYNLMVPMLWRHPQKVDVNSAKVVHFCANGSKPWRYTGEEDNMERKDVKMLVEKWWNIYNDSSLDFTKSTDQLPYCGLKNQRVNFNEATRPSPSALMMTILN